MRSNLIPITRIYDIYPKYTYSNDVKKFMDEIVDIDRANVFTKADMVDLLDKIRAEIESQRKEVSKKHSENEGLSNYYFGLNDGLKDARDILDKYMEERLG